ncbi:MAG: hypothetical protein KAX38_00245, partial [Candidatus Krumholzibacteria bacterium]|nr:hypothetical protein [Candidatus Krumholzibacteria bacterium]
KKRQLDEFLGKMALRSIKRFFLIAHIAEAEGVEVTDEEVDAEIEAIAADSGRPIEEITQALRKGSENLSNLRNRLRERKVFEIVLGDA